MSNNFTREDLEFYKGFKKKFFNKVDEILNLKYELETGFKYYEGEITEIEFDNGKIEVSTYEESYCSCCSGTSHHYSFPESYLFDENWVDDVKRKIAEKEEKKRLEKEALERKRKEERLIKEKAEYERLKKKFE